MTLTLQLLSCNSCGGPLDVPAVAIFVTCGHCGSRLAIRRTETAAYTEILQQLERRFETVKRELDDIAFRNIGGVGCDFPSFRLENETVRTLGVAAAVFGVICACVFYRTHNHIYAGIFGLLGVGLAGLMAVVWDHGTE